MIKLLSYLDNIKRGPITTIAGALIVIAAWTALFFDKAELVEAVEATILSLVLVLAPDPKNSNGIGLFLVVFFLVLFSAAGCKKPAVVSSSSVKADSIVEYTIRIDTIHVPGDSIVHYIQLQCDSLGQVIQVSQTVKGSRIRQSIKVDSAGMLTASATCDAYQALVEIQDQLIRVLKTKQEKQVITVTDYKTHWYDYVSRVIALVSLLLFTIKFYTK